MITSADLILWSGELGKSTRDFVTKSLGDALSVVNGRLRSLEERLATVQTTPGPKGDTGERGEKGDAGRDAVLPDLDVLAQKAAVYVPKPLDGAPGRDAAVDFEVLAAKAASLVPVPRDGINGKDAAPPDLDVIAAKAAALLPVPKDGAHGRDGLSVTLDDIRPLIAEAVREAVAALPKPKNGTDGTSLTAEDVAPMVVAEVQKAAAAIPVPKDGVGVAGAVIDRDGRLILTLSNGMAQELGAVVGRDGKDYEPEVVKAWIADEVAKIPRPQDGRDGAPGERGADGIGIDHADMTFDETKGYTLVMRGGDRSLEMRLPQGWDAGVWRQGRQYPKGCNVTFKGDQWTAQVDTMNRPGDTPDWRLAVRRGRDGKDLRNVNGTD